MPEEEENEDHILRSTAGVQVGVTCTSCNRLMDGTKPRECAECARESRRESRQHAKDEKDAKDD